MPKAADKQMDAFYGKDHPSASFKWGVIIPITIVQPGVPTAVQWRAVAWFKSRKRAVEYAESGWSTYAIARTKPNCVFPRSVNDSR